MTAHISLANTVGPKAGFDAYMAGTVHTAEARRAEIRSAGNKKAQFNAYCALFGDQFKPVSGNGAVHSAEQVEDVKDSLLSRIAQKLGVTVAELAEVVEDEPETPVAPREIPAATRISWPMAMTLKKLATKSGQTFEITSKSGGKGTDELANYGITLGGSVLNPSQASALIAASKA